MTDIAFGDGIFLAFQTPFARVTRTLFTLAGDIVLVGDHFGPYESFLKIGVYCAGRLRCARIAAHGPGTHFFFAGGKKRLQIQQTVTGSNNPIQPGLIETELIEKVLAFLGLQRGRLRHDHAGTG